ncbi:protein-L-isoaspartate O-methyltransferase family protein [Sphingomonas jatrophae]|uniref:Protein-L-isoaspartate O-methyltransferase n=1 Tax=Sphingomonas jatrophae TaxID=1166337 RepID=A0A1I6JTA0_9SPHN|nr:protein-L-isoaspartate O-methyltransferase [Sphingomonas jatrophae]SFR82187.1 protein-L-isoaspartate(D-aspartate) O-methyltransferase [Sphingomonas jatrophae]
MTETSFETLRRAMVASQLRPNAVNDPRVIAAMSVAPREAFVPEEWRRLAYSDRAIPLAPGRALMPAMMLGRLLTEARLQAEDRALVVGAGGGYSAAVLAQLVASVVALEEAGVAPAGVPAIDKVQRVEGPLTEGWAAGAPYDLILIDGAVEEVPHTLVAQLAEGGRIAVPLIRSGVVRLSVGVRGGEGIGYSSFADADVPALPGFARPRSFTF